MAGARGGTFSVGATALPLCVKVSPISCDHGMAGGGDTGRVVGHRLRAVRTPLSATRNGSTDHRAEQIESLEQINSISEINGSFDSCKM